MTAMSVGAFLHINTELCHFAWFKQKWRGVRFERSLWEPEVLKVNIFFTEPLSMEGKYAVKLSITELIKINRK